MDIRVLQYFLAVAREESITKAELLSSDENITGEIRIGSGETDAVSYFAQAARKLQKKHPMIHYHIYSGDAERIMEWLDKGLIDFGLLIGSADIEKYDYMRLPIADTWGVLMPKDSPLAQKDAIWAEDLHDKPLILSHQAESNSEMLSWLKTDAAKLNIVLSYDLIYNASHFVKKNLGYAITLDKLVNTAGDSELCFRPLYPPMQAGLELPSKTSLCHSGCIQPFGWYLGIFFSDDEPVCLKLFQIEVFKDGLRLKK